VSLLGTVQRAATRAIRAVTRNLPGTVVLVYHRVAEPPSDPQLLSVSPENFAEHMKVVSELGTCIPLRRLVGNGTRKPLRRGIVITFDDGYADNLETAEPILRDAGVPATVFVSTGGLETNTPFWWDELEALLLRSNDLPPEISITLANRRMSWEMRSAAMGADKNPCWDITIAHDPTKRHAVYRTVHSMCREMTAAQRETILTQLRRQITAPATPSHARRLTGEQVAALADSPVVEVGAHGVTHSVFKASSPDHNKWELEHSRTRLAELTGKKPALFAYPFGARSDVTPDLPRLVRECGFIAACANWPGLVRWYTHRYLIPRFVVRDWRAQEFADRLGRWLGGLYL